MLSQFSSIIFCMVVSCGGNGIRLLFISPDDSAYTTEALNTKSLAETGLPYWVGNCAFAKITLFLHFEPSCISNLASTTYTLSSFLPSVPKYVLSYHTPKTDWYLCYPLSIQLHIEQISFYHTLCVLYLFYFYLCVFLAYSQCKIHG